MVTCKSCQSSETTVEQGKLWCTGCGTELEDCPTWVTSYAVPNHFKRFPVYSRVKRFIEYLRKINKQELNNIINEIIDYFGVIEFQWNMRKHISRKYFFNKYVVLFFIARMLDVHIELRTLKDEERVKDQLKEISVLVSDFIEKFD